MSEESLLKAARDNWRQRAERAEAEAERIRERVATLERALKSLRCEQLDMEPGMWGIRCIEDHNAIIDAALTAKEST